MTSTLKPPEKCPVCGTTPCKIPKSSPSPSKGMPKRYRIECLDRVAYTAQEAEDGGWCDEEEVRIALNTLQKEAADAGDEYERRIDLLQDTLDKATQKLGEAAVERVAHKVEGMPTREMPRRYSMDIRFDHIYSSLDVDGRYMYAKDVLAALSERDATIQDLRAMVIELNTRLVLTEQASMKAGDAARTLRGELQELMELPSSTPGVERLRESEVEKLSREPMIRSPRQGWFVCTGCKAGAPWWRDIRHEKGCAHHEPD